MEDKTTRQWAEEEFGGAVLGDKRRTERLVKTAAGKAQSPDSAMSLCCGRGSAQSICRLFDNEKVNFDSVTAAHKEQTRNRCREYDTVYAVQDTTFLDFSGHKALEGLGSLPNHKTPCGLVMHNLLAVSAEKVPIGVLGAEIWARDPKDYGNRRKNRHKRPIEDKETRKWLWGKEQAGEILSQNSRVILVGDRGSDLFELFCAPRQPNLELLVRVKHNRRVENNDDVNNAKLFKLMEGSPVMGEYRFTIPSRHGRKKREAVIEVKAGAATLPPPQYLIKNGKEPVSLNWVWAREKDVTRGAVKPIDWKLFTTVPVDSFADAMECIHGYSCRWVIEEYHRVLKSGVKIERLQFEILDRMLPAMGVCCVIAWRVLFLSKYFRERPDESASNVSSEVERLVLSGWLKTNGYKRWRVRTVKDFIVNAAMLGGYPGRKNDGPPGTKTLWQGLRRLDSMVEGYLMAAEIQKISQKEEMS